MDILVEVSQDEDLIVVADRLAAEELLGLLKSGLVLGDLVGFRVEYEAVRYPTVVSAEYQDFSVLSKREAAEGVSGTPLLVLVDKRHHLPLLVL